MARKTLPTLLICIPLGGLAALTAAAAAIAFLPGTPQSAPASYVMALPHRIVFDHPAFTAPDESPAAAAAEASSLPSSAEFPAASPTPAEPLAATSADTDAAPNPPVQPAVFGEVVAAAQSLDVSLPQLRATIDTSSKGESPVAALRSLMSQATR